MSEIARKKPGNLSSRRAHLTSLKQKNILDAATRLFMKQGFHGCSMDAVAEELGATKQVIYYQFVDKKELLAAICRVGAELSLSAVIAAEARQGTSTERMAWFCERLTDIVVSHGSYLAVYHREMGSLREDDYTSIMRLRGRIDRRVARLVADGLEAGEFDVPDPLIAARAITGMISFMTTWLPPTGVSDQYPRLVEMMTDIAMRTLRPSLSRSVRKRSP